MGITGVHRAGLVWVCLALLSCTGPGISTPKYTTASAPAVRAANRASDSFAAAQLTAKGVHANGTIDLYPNDRAELMIRKDALEREFLFHASLIPQTGQTTSRGLKARVVAFRHLRDSVYLLEANPGHIVSRDLPAQSVLAQFPIRKETDTDLTIDFNAGMSRIFTAVSLSTSDETGKGINPEEAVSVSLSYIDAIKVTDANVEIRQIALLPIPAGKSSSYEIRYFIQPYRPDPSFEIHETSDFQRVGFFEVSPLIEESSGTRFIPISRWSLKQPITFSISANTPPEYVDAMKEGILYWNRAFGRDVLRAQMAPTGVTAPSPHYNIIQWIPYDTATTAYADALMDPRTGEILHAQIYLPSAFAFVTKARIPPLLRRFKEEELTKKSQPSLAGFSLSTLCDLDGKEDYVGALQALASLNPGGDIDWVRATRDYVRWTVAHEVGHTLGLRHNFAGSLAATVTMSQRDQLLQNYLATGEVPLSQTLTSSVMDYVLYFDSILGSAQIQATQGALTYDRNAIQWGYFGRALPADSPLFCTDSQLKMYRDCQQLDWGPSPIVTNTEKIDSILRTLPATIVESYLMARTAIDPRDRKPFNEVELDPKVPVEIIINTLKAQLAWFGETGVPSLAAERTFANRSAINEDAVLATERESVRQGLKDAGGIEPALFSLLPSDKRESVQIYRNGMATLTAYLAKPDVRSGTGYDYKPYALNDADVAAILDAGARYFHWVEDKLLERTVETYGTGGLRVSADLAGPDYEARLGAAAKTIVLAQTTAGVPGTNPASPPPAFEFRYKQALRVKAIRMLIRSGGATTDWSFPARREIGQRLKELLKSATGVEPPAYEPGNYPRPLQRWVADQSELLTELSKAAAN